MLKMPIFKNPASLMESRYSFSCMAPATHPAYISADFWSGKGKFPWRTTFEMQKRPPGFRMRNISRNAFFLSDTRLSTQLLITISADSELRGSASISPNLNFTFVYPHLRLFSSAFWIISGVISIPMTFQESPTKRLVINTLLPAQEHKSTPVSPSWIWANSVGNSHPNPRSASETYPFIPWSACVPQHQQHSLFRLAFFTIYEYFFFTICLIFFLIHFTFSFLNSRYW